MESQSNSYDRDVYNILAYLIYLLTLIIYIFKHFINFYKSAWKVKTVEMLIRS